MWYQRLERPDGVFFYLDVDRQTEVVSINELERIEKLHIPRAYQNVMINKNRRAKVLAYGYDSRGRKQTIYAPWFIQKQATKKYAKVVEVDGYMPKLIERIHKDIVGSGGDTIRHKHNEKYKKDQMIAVVLYLMIACGFRVGNEKYAAENKSYGLTTLEVRHVRIKSREGMIEIKFIGKKGVENIGVIHKKDVPIVYKYMIKSIKNKERGDRVFTGLSSDDVNEYLREIHPDITSKDIRTWNANQMFLTHIMKNHQNQGDSKKVITVSEKQVKRDINIALDQVAAHLHHTRDVCKKNYIHPDFVEFARIVMIQREGMSNISHAFS